MNERQGGGIRCRATAGGKFVRSAAEVSSKYAWELFADEGVLGYLDGKLERGCT